MILIKVTCAIILRNDKVFVGQRKANLPIPSKWEFPGGKIMRHESEEDCIIRELKEELNIEVQVLKRLTPHTHQYSN